MKNCFQLFIILTCSMLLFACLPAPRPNPLAESPDFPIKPSVLYKTVQTYCLDCHNPEKMKGNIDLTRAVEGKLNDRPFLWLDVAHALKHKEMPPEDEGVERPDDKTYLEVNTWLEKRFKLNNVNSK